MAPEVPGLENNTPQYSENVPGVQFPFRQEFGKVGEATERIGEATEGLASKGSEIYDEIQRQHDISTASSNAVAVGVAHAQTMQNLKLSSPDGFSHDPTTNEILKNSDGSQRTISQDYWDYANSDYQQRQNNMSPRAAAMFRQQVQPEIGQNTRELQGAGLVLQQKASEQSLQQNLNTLARQNDVTPWSRPGSSDPAQYSDPQKDGSILLRGNTNEINRQLQQITKDTAQRGPVQDAQGNWKPGMFNPTQVQAMTQANLSTHAESWLTSALTNISENAGPRDRSNVLSTTALQQVNDLRDVVEGRDPKSQEAISKNLPTIHTSLDAEQIDHWRARLDAFKPEAQDIDKSEYKLNLEQLKGFSHNVTSVKQLMTSPLFQHTVSSGEPLGLTPAERVKDLAEVFSNAATSSGLSRTSGLASPDAKMAAATQAYQQFQTAWPQYAKQLGIKDTDGFGDAVVAEAKIQIQRKLQEDADEYRRDPIAYAGKIRQGPTGPDGQPRYNDQMTASVAAKLDPKNYPSLYAVFQSMPNGKSVLENAQEASGRTYSVGNMGPDVHALNKEEFEDQKDRLLGLGQYQKSTKNAEGLESYFHALSQQKISTAQKQAFQQQLVNVGGLPQPYIDALNLKTPSERYDRWTQLMTDNKEFSQFDKDASDASAKNNSQLNTLQDLKYGPNDPRSFDMKNSYDKSWQSSYKAFRGAGQSDSEAAISANEMREKTTGSIGIISAQHHFGNLFSWGHTGPQVQVEYGSPLPDATKQNINSNLLKFQSADELGKYKFVPVPGANPSNPNAPATADWVAAHAALWERIPSGYRLSVQEMTKDGQPTGKKQWVQVYSKDGKSKQYYDVSDDTARAAPPTGFTPAVMPSPRANNGQ